MLPRIRRPIGPAGQRRGVTLVEMLVVVALVVLMMTILVQIFQSATGAMSLSRTTSEMDVTLRQVESILRTDLAGVTAKMTPPNDPKDQRGYFEYGENAPADAQGEDTDDTLGFTTKAPDGSFFTGRQMILLPGPAVNNINPYTVAPITSQVAEVIYFLRNGNLYRRVLLVAPERQSSLYQPVVADSTRNLYTFAKNPFGVNGPVSWQSLNDISCRPTNQVVGNVLLTKVVANTLGDLTNRERRAFRPRFEQDYTSNDNKGNYFTRADGTVDDYNGDGLPDYYPTIYSNGASNSYTDPQGIAGTVPNPWTFSSNSFPTGSGRVAVGGTSSSWSVYGFPFIYPGMYTFPRGLTGGAFSGPTRLNSSLGWSHSLAPGQTTNAAGTTIYALNHSPLLTGDNITAPAGMQAWFGYPTWRESMTGPGANTPGWSDPIVSVANNAAYSLLQPLGLQPFNPTTGPSVTGDPTTSDANLLPPIGTFATPLPYTDPAAGYRDAANGKGFVVNQTNPNQVWEDDLLLTGVRSFDVKAYDPNAPLYSTPVVGLFSAGYQDLGYGSTIYELTGSAANPKSGYNSVAGPNGPVDPTTTAQVPVNWQAVGGEPVGFGHEGRIPPIPSDFRYHPRRPYNIGDPGLGVIRLTRVWDSWSTDYTNAPDYDIFLNHYPTSTFAIYPSFPAPYPTALRGIQIQIRLTDARGERTKPITIRHDFTDKL